MRIGLLGGSPLFVEAGDGGGGGGGALTVESVGAQIAAAITKSQGDMTAKFQTMLKPFEGLGDTLKTITEGLTGLQEKVATPAPDGKKKDGELAPEVNARFQTLEKTIKTQGDQLAASETARKAAEQKAKDTEKESSIRSALGQFTFASPEAAEDAFTLMSGKVAFDDEGKLVADGLPLADFVKDYIPTKKGHLLQPLGKGGSGAQGGSPRGGSNVFDMDKIRPGMSAEETAQAAGAIMRAVKSGS